MFAGRLGGDQRTGVCQARAVTTYCRSGAGAPVFFGDGVQTLFFRATVLAAAALLASPAAQAEQVLCHYTYGGETRTLQALPVSSPYPVKAIDVGSFFHFRVVFQNQPADIASIKIYTYADRDDGPLLIHQAIFAYPPATRAGAPDGFSGRQVVHEPVRDGELQYWCELVPAARALHKVAP